MWYDILTNTLQGMLFRDFIAELVNFLVDYEDGEITC